MRVLIADDDLTYCRTLEVLLRKWGYDPIVTSDGDQAWKILQTPQGPQLAILDWMMPGKDGVEICRLVRQATPPRPTYIILLTSKERKEDIVSGLDAGAEVTISIRATNAAVTRARRHRPWGAVVFR